MNQKYIRIILSLLSLPFIYVVLIFIGFTVSINLPTTSTGCELNIKTIWLHCFMVGFLCFALVTIFTLFFALLFIAIMYIYRSCYFLRNVENDNGIKIKVNGIVMEKYTDTPDATDATDPPGTINTVL